jgi:hypothetical protein
MRLSKGDVVVKVTYCGRSPSMENLLVFESFAQSQAYAKNIPATWPPHSRRSVMPSRLLGDRAIGTLLVIVEHSSPNAVVINPLTQLKVAATDFLKAVSSIKALRALVVVEDGEIKFKCTSRVGCRQSPGH